MGYGTRDRHIRTFWPDDTEDTFYIDSSWDTTTLQDILDKAKKKWGEAITLEELRIRAEHIHTDCLGYDRYDSGDYTNFLVIERIPKG